MYFRFISALVLAGLVSLAGITLQKQSLDLRRRISRQHYELDVLRDQQSRLRLNAERLGAPPRMINSLQQHTLEFRRPEGAEQQTRGDGPASDEIDPGTP